MKKYFISVSEPWDFQSPDGENIIYGRVLKILDYRHIIFKTDHPLQMRGITNDILILSPRHDRDFYPMHHNKSITVNAGLYKGVYDESLTEKELSNCEFVIIGSINSTVNWLL